MLSWIHHQIVWEMHWFITVPREIWCDLVMDGTRACGPRAVHHSVTPNLTRHSDESMHFSSNSMMNSAIEFSKVLSSCSYFSIEWIDVWHEWHSIQFTYRSSIILGLYPREIPQLYLSQCRQSSTDIFDEKNIKSFLKLKRKSNKENLSGRTLYIL